MNEFDGRRDSRKKRRLSERRRVFSRIGHQNSGGSAIYSTMAGGNYKHRLLSAGSSGNDEQSTSSTTFSISAGSSNMTGEDSTTLGATTISSGTAATYQRSDSPLTAAAASSVDNTKISMKIQFHITVAPDNEPLILDTSNFVLSNPPTTEASSPVILDSDCGLSSSNSSSGRRQKSVESIGEQIAAKLSRQNTASTRRRQQLLAMHHQSALDTNKQQQQLNRASMRRHTGISPDILDQKSSLGDDHEQKNHSEDNIILRTPSSGGVAAASSRLDQDGEASSTTSYHHNRHLLETRQQGARSSTITGGMSDEATIKFLEKQHQTRPSIAANHHLQATKSLNPSLSNSMFVSTSSSLLANNQRAKQQQTSHLMREHIYFKRDGQRFGHEFTLKLAVNKTYRCLLKVRPLIPLQAISIQGSQILFADCSQRNVIQTTNSGSIHSAASQPNSGAARSSFSNINRFSPSQSTNLYSSYSSTSALNRSWQNIHNTTNNCGSLTNRTSINSQLQSPNNHHHYHNHQHHRLNHAQTTNSINLRHDLQMNHDQQLPINLYQQQQNQMLRHFAASHCSSSSSSHLGGQLIYMFDWSANRFEVNKNKNRTQVNTVLKFKNGQILSLPLQVKFYQSECKQHLNWGSQLHFIDYDCNINNMGQINIDRIQYY